MTTIVTRSGKGSPLTHAEMDANLTNLNTNKAEINSPTLTTPILNTPTVNTPTITNPTISAGNLILSGTGQTIQGDFSNATVSSRVRIQSSTLNGLTSIPIIPNGTGTTTSVLLQNSSDPVNYAYTSLACTSSDSRVVAGVSGTGTLLPLIFNVGGSERIRIDTAGLVGIGVTPAYNLDVMTTAGRIALSNSGAANRINSVNTTNVSSVALELNASSHTFKIGGTTTLVIDSSGNITQNYAGGLGYGPGAGGTVTQATSKSTAVTLNKPAGQITTSNASLTAGTVVNFQLNNSLISAVDSVQATLAGGEAVVGTTCVWVCNVSAGVASIAIWNRSGATTSDTLKINFAIIKGATS